MNNSKIISPCISICKNNPISGYCYGCARTDKEKKIWKELRKIKKGKTKSYGEIARKFIVSPRYVGKVCGQNKHILVIPCHRVLRSNGSISGFSAPGGTKLKRKLIQFESKQL